MIYWQDFALKHCYNILKDHQASGGFNLNNEVDEPVEETQEVRPMGRDRSKTKKKSSASSPGGSSSFVDLVADKFLNIKKKIKQEGGATTVLYQVEESGVEYSGGRASGSCRVEKRENCNSALNA
nr:hypothetical protein [Tanacetum cinerariifolium]